MLQRSQNGQVLSPAELARVLNTGKLKLPDRPRVTHVWAEDYTDWSGDDALAVFILLADSTPKSDRTYEQIEPIERAVFDALRDSGESRFPYLTTILEREFANKFVPPRQIPERAHAVRRSDVARTVSK